MILTGVLIIEYTEGPENFPWKNRGILKGNRRGEI